MTHPWAIFSIVKLRGWFGGLILVLTFSVGDGVIVDVIIDCNVDSVLYPFWSVGDSWDDVTSKNKIQIN